MGKRKNFILKMLILLGLLAILASCYVQYGIPYQKEKEGEKRDEQRIADLDEFNTEIQKILAGDPRAYAGEPNTIYISLPSLKEDCANLELPSLPEGWKYHCVKFSAVRNTDGTGWLPIDFENSAESKHSNILENVGMLPIDPTNSTDSLNYYAFVASSTSATTTEYVVTAVLDSKKYLHEKAQTDGGSDPIRYESGFNLRLWATANGLIGYWPINEGEGITIHDLIDGNNGTVINDPAWEKESDDDNHFFLTAEI